MVINKPISKQLRFSIMTITISTQDHLKRMQIQRKHRNKPTKPTKMGNQHLQHLSKFQIYRCSKSDIVATGALFEQPERLGFNHRRPTEVRSIPKYFLTQPKLLYTLSLFKILGIKKIKIN